MALTFFEVSEIRRGNEELIEKHSLKVLKKEPKFSTGDVVCHNKGKFLTDKTEVFQILDIRQNGYKVVHSSWQHREGTSMVNAVTEVSEIKKIWEILIKDVTPEEQNVPEVLVKRRKAETRWVYERDYELV